MKRLIIEQLKEGFIFLDEVGERYAVSSAGISIKVKAYFGLTDHSKSKKYKTINNIAPPAETKGSTTADSHSAGATSQSSSTERVEVAPLGGDALANEKPKLSTHDTILQPRDLKIAKFDYSGWSPKQHKSLQFWELPDGKAVLEYGNSKYYTSKDAVMQIPFPFPRKYFNKENGWSSTVEQAFKMYRRYLAEQKEPEGQTDGTCDDIAFETCANNDPKICKFCVNESRYEDKRKLAARKPGAPLLKASMGV